MAGGGFGRVQKASALLPLAVLSIAWTASLVTAGSDGSSAGSGLLPDGSRVPAEAVRAPASLTAPRTLPPGHAVARTAFSSDHALSPPFACPNASRFSASEPATGDSLTNPHVLPHDAMVDRAGRHRWRGRQRAADKKEAASQKLFELHWNSPDFEHS